MKERIFIQNSKERVAIKEFIKNHFSDGKCGNIEIQHTPLVTRIIIHTSTPGYVIGTGGEKIKETIEILKNRFKMENPQIDVQKITVPDLDPEIIAQNIRASLESGANFNYLGKFFVSKIMRAGAIGCEIIVSGKLSGQRSRKVRFGDGYIKKTGNTNEVFVSVGTAIANRKLGNVGITVKIMEQHPDAIRTTIFKDEPKPSSEEINKEEAKTDGKNNAEKKVPEAKEAKKKESTEKKAEKTGNKKEDTKPKEIKKDEVKKNGDNKEKTAEGNE